MNNSNDLVSLNDSNSHTPYHNIMLSRKFVLFFSRDFFVEFQIKLLLWIHWYFHKFNICFGFILFFFLFKHEKRTTITDRLVYVIALTLFRLIIYIKIVTKQSKPDGKRIKWTIFMLVCLPLFLVHRFVICSSSPKRCLGPFVRISIQIFVKSFAFSVVFMNWMYMCNGCVCAFLSKTNRYYAECIRFGCFGAWVHSELP